MEIGYCKNCNIPIRGNRCNLCNKETLKLKFHELGDIRFISKYERRILLSLIPIREVKEYLRKRIILLSKQPGLDFRKDVFVDGFKIGTMEYIKDKKWRWSFTPTGKGAKLFYVLSGEADFELKARGHLKGKKINRNIKNWELFSSGNCVGVAVKTEKGAKVKDIYCGKIYPTKKSNIKDSIKGNISFLNKIEENAITLIKKSKAKYIAFSGGKDSEVTLYLGKKAGIKKVIYMNTGLEFPETERFVYNFVDYMDMELIEITPDRDFWTLVEEKGIPTKDYRWCTKYLKLDGLKKFKGIIVDGSRRYESLGRMSKNNSKNLGYLKVVYPILNWLALDVWLFIYWKNLPYNPLYDMGYERIGCFMCPSMLNAEFHHLKHTHPDLFRKWYNYLKSKGYSNKEIMDGLWRWKLIPPKIKEISKS